MKRECLRPAEIPPDPEPPNTTGEKVAGVFILTFFVGMVGFLLFMIGAIGHAIGHRSGYREGVEGKQYSQQDCAKPMPEWWQGDEDWEDPVVKFKAKIRSFEQ